uniref:Uncharacterized LOC100183869 n=1 Tax=Ciona intestinalis TaxID=7719 RepID=F6WT77_CIOIN|nr:uncharacterized protein LOC100183869 [Ciona intestinalis]|eukprot:XP_002130697.1 uncharacterized protein LOC100183869 [Ciona intestinalis]
MPCGKLSVFICIILSIAPATVGLRCYQNYTVTSFMWSVSHYNIGECNIGNSTVDLSCVRFESRVKALPGFGTVLYGKCVPTSECSEDLCSTLRVDQINPFFRKLSCTASCCSYDGCNGDMATTAASTATTVNATVPTGILTDNRGLALHNITTTEPNVTESEISDVTTDGSPMTSAVTDVTSSRPTKINVHSRVTTSVLDSRDATTQKGGSTNLQVSAKIILSVLSIVLIVVN